MARYIIRSTDVGAPILSGLAGAMVGVLDYALPIAGWSKVYSGTNKAVYRAPAGNRFYLRVDDPSNSTTCRCIVYETMSDVDTGTGLSPTTAQISGGIYWAKSNGTTSAARPWVIAVDDKIMPFFWVDYDASSNAGYLQGFGTFKSYLLNDNYNTIIFGGTNGLGTSYWSTIVLNDPTALLQGHYISRRYDQISTAIQCTKIPTLGAYKQGTSMGTTNLKYPDPITGRLPITGCLIGETALDTTIRGRLPALWGPACARPLAHGDTVSGAEGSILEGKTFEAFNTYSTSQVFLETSDTWYDVEFQ